MTSRHPSFRWHYIPDDQRITSTEAARILAGPDGVLGFDRLAALRAAGLLQVVDSNRGGPRFDRLEVEYHQDYEFPVADQPAELDDDDLGPARMLAGVLVAAVLITAVVGVWVVLR